MHKTTIQSFAKSLCEKMLLRLHIQDYHNRNDVQDPNNWKQCVQCTKQNLSMDVISDDNGYEEAILYFKWGE